MRSPIEGPPLSSKSAGRNAGKCEGNELASKDCIPSKAPEGAKVLLNQACCAAFAARLRFERLEYSIPTTALIIAGLASRSGRVGLVCCLSALLLLLCGFNRLYLPAKEAVDDFIDRFALSNGK